MLELWGMRSTPSLPSIPGTLWSRVVAPDRVLSMGQIELNCVLMLNWITWNKTVFTFNSVYCPVGRGCRIHRLHLCRVVRPSNECPRYDNKQSDGEVPVMLVLWGMWSNSSLPSLPGPLWPGVVASDWVLTMGQIEAKCVFILKWIVWNRTVLIFNCVWKNILILNWIVWIRVVWLNLIAWNGNVFDN